MKVLLCYSPAPRVVVEETLTLAPGCTAWEALSHSISLREHRHMQPNDAQPQQVLLGVWGRKCPPDQALQDKDRLELYRPLKVDPKVARRERYQKQGPGVAGRFAKLRAGAKQGY
jgi:uncharacterized protein